MIISPDWCALLSITTVLHTFWQVHFSSVWVMVEFVPLHHQLEVVEAECVSASWVYIRSDMELELPPGEKHYHRFLEVSVVVFLFVLIFVDQKLERCWSISVSTLLHLGKNTGFIITKHIYPSWTNTVKEM